MFDYARAFIERKGDHTAPLLVHLGGGLREN